MRRAALLALTAALLTPRVHAQDAPLTLVLGGDVIFDAPIEYALRRTDRDRDAASSYAPVFQDLAPVLSAADLAIVNLETPVATRTRSSGEGDAPRFAAPRAFLTALRDAGVDAVTLANNHAYDQGVAGLAETLAALGEDDIAGIGGGEAPAEARYVTVRGESIALLAFAEGTNWRVLEDEADAPRVAILNPERITAAITAARVRASFVAVAFHWTEGRDHVPSPRMRRYARLAANAGADLVWGHGTHLPAGTSTVRAEDGRAVPVIWSLGNLVAVMNSDDEDVFTGEPSVREAWLAQLVLRRAGDRLEVASIGAVPFWIGLSEHEDAEPFVRPLSMVREREHLRRHDCGRRCDRLAAAYAARSERASRLLSLDEPEPPVESPREERLASVTLTPAPDEVHPTPPPRASDAPRPAPRPRPVERGREVVRPVTPDVARTVAPEVAPDVTVATDLGPIATGILAIEFPLERAVESGLDADQLARVVAALRADGRLRLEIIAHPSSAADRALWARRGARARGLVAVRGPSRTRITSRLGSPEGAGRLTYRLVR